MIDRSLGVELLGVERLLDRAKVHLGIILGEDVVEAALRQPHVERHLAALEAGDRDALTALLALLAAPAGLALARADAASDADFPVAGRSEEHTSELQSLMRISYAVFCLKKKKYNTLIIFVQLCT